MGVNNIADDIHDAYEEGYKDGMEFAKNEIMEEAKARFTPKWISVNDRLPNDYGAVLVTWGNRNPEWYYAHIKDTPFVGVAHFYPKTKRWYWYSAVTEDYLSEYGDSEFDRVDKSIDITHWMPLPEPPKEGETCD